jgi:hypothetical protein
MRQQMMLPEIFSIGNHAGKHRIIFYSLPYFPAEEQTEMVFPGKFYEALASFDGFRGHSHDEGLLII